MDGPSSPAAGQQRGIPAPGTAPAPTRVQRVLACLELTLVLLLFLMSVVTMGAGLVALVAHLLGPSLEWPKAFGAELLAFGEGLSRCWIAVVIFSLVLFYAPLRQFLYRLHKAGPLETHPTPEDVQTIEYKRP